MIQVFLIQLLILNSTFSQFLNTPGYMPYPQRYYDEYDYTRLGRQRFHRRSGGKFPEYSADSNYDYGRANCRCSCRNCENIKPCCVSVCDNCNSQSLVFVPYPVPLVIAITSKSTPNTSTTTSSTVTTTTTTTTTTPSTKTENLPEITTFSTPTYAKIKQWPKALSTSPFFNKRLLMGKKKKCLGGQCLNYRRIDLIDHLLRNEDGRRAENYDDFDVKLEKGHQFGIIPIPNKMALEFMTNMRDMKLNELLQSKV